MVTSAGFSIISLSVSLYTSIVICMSSKHAPFVEQPVLKLSSIGDISKTVDYCEAMSVKSSSDNKKVLVHGIT